MTVAAIVAAAVALGLADPAWAGVSAWGLLTIGATQKGGTEWGCLRAICPSCDAYPQDICTNGEQPPLGWGAACANLTDSNSANATADCVLEASMSIVNSSIGTTALVFAALLVGVIVAVVEAVARPPAAATSAAVPA